MSAPKQLRQSSSSALPFILLQRATSPPPSAHYRAGYTNLHIYKMVQEDNHLA